MSRRLTREISFRALFQTDIGNSSSTVALKYAMEGFKLSKQDQELARELVEGTLDNLEIIDGIIKKNLVKWDLSRISAVDRNLLRLALFEIFYRPDIPKAVSINEALELAKKYGSTGEAVAFINGLLDKVVGEVLGREG